MQNLWEGLRQMVPEQEHPTGYIPTVMDPVEFRE